MQLSCSSSTVGVRLAATLVLSGLGVGCGPPKDLVYSEDPAIYLLGTAITPNRPSNFGGEVLLYSVHPALPAGLSFDSLTGVITGTPTTITATANYLVTASNPLGKTTISLSITVVPREVFYPTGSMVTARGGHTATMLPNGNVLIAGGDGKGGAELYDPSIGTFSLTGSMSVARYRHTATLLPDGKVLIAGGYRTSDSELYDPATETFAPTGSMSTARSDHTATLLPNAKVLIAGGYTGNYAATAELYDPATGTFAPTGSMSTARSGHTATLLPNGKVLIAGGSNINGSLTSAELYDPATGTFASTGRFGVARWSYTATLLPNG